MLVSVQHGLKKYRRTLSSSFELFPNTDHGLQLNLNLKSLQHKRSRTPVDVLIKCRENTMDGEKEKEISLCTDLCLEKRSIDTGGYVLHCDTAPHGSQCLNHLTVIVLSSRTQSAAPGPPVTHPKGCLLQRHFFFKIKAF